jgi:hypothetical protein
MKIPHLCPGVGPELGGIEQRHRADPADTGSQRLFKLGNGFGNGVDGSSSGDNDTS